MHNTLTDLIFLCRCVEESWPTFYPGVETSDGLSIGYTISFYWIATTLSQTGYGDIRPYLTLEYVFTIFLMSIAFIVFNLCVISITAMLLNSSYSKLVGIIISNMIWTYVCVCIMRLLRIMNIRFCKSLINKLVKVSVPNCRLFIIS